MKVTIISNDNSEQNYNNENKQNYNNENEGESNNKNLFIIDLIYIGLVILIDLQIIDKVAQIP